MEELGVYLHHYAKRVLVYVHIDILIVHDKKEIVHGFILFLTLLYYGLIGSETQQLTHGEHKRRS